MKENPSTCDKLSHMCQSEVNHRCVLLPKDTANRIFQFMKLTLADFSPPPVFPPSVPIFTASQMQQDQSFSTERHVSEGLSAIGHLSM